MRLSLLAILCAVGTAAGQDLVPWAADKKPGDVPKSHVETVSKASHAYAIVQGGTIDGRSCRSPNGVYEGFVQTWESNRAVRMENVGESDVINPWLSNGRNNFRTVHEIVASALKPGMTDREKALAIYDQWIRHRWHWGGENDEQQDPVKIMNVYGSTTCGADANCMGGMWKRAGLKVAAVCAVGHCISQVWFDGRWNLMDGDQQGLYLGRDGRTVASEAEIARDHDLVKRAHTLGVLHPAARNVNEFQASLFVKEDGERQTRDSAARHTMDMTLRPGEALVWRWGRRNPLKLHGQSGGHRAPVTVANGRWEYRPDFAKEPWKKGADKAENVRATPEGLAAESGKAGLIEWTIKSPYVFVGGLLESEGSGARFEASIDGAAWSPLQGSLDALFPESTKATYAWRLRCTLEGDARLKKLAVLADVQMSPLAMPEMAVGENKFAYTDATQGARSVKITHEWVERSSTKPPAAPAAAVTPKDGGESDGTQITFAWSAAKDPDGDKITDYHFQLSDRADFAYVLSSMMNRLVSRVGGKGEEKFALPAPGHLAPDGKYYWRVLAQDANGVWGPWSAVWSFTARGPAVPLDVKVDFDAAKGEGVFRWTPNAAGTKAAKYRVYGSDEKGFSISDAADGNFIAETTKPELLVLSRTGGSNRAHYRVVALDGSGRRSADSDFASAPRPFLFAGPAKVKAGKEFKLAVGAVRSLGDARTRDGNKLQMGMYEVEKPKFSLASAPAWLTIDPATGMLSGTPPAAGKVNVAVSAVLEVEDRTLDIRSLVWGHDKVLATSTKTLGPAKLDLAIEVEP